MLAFTGYYKGKRITVFASGMGCPSIGIYAYELYQIYNVKAIVRLGTSGAISPDLSLLDVVIADSSYCFSNYPKLFFQDDAKEFMATKELNDQLEQVAFNRQLQVHRGRIATTDFFDVYVNDKDYLNKLYHQAKDPLCIEMEAAALFAIAKHLNREAACVLTIVDSPTDKHNISPKDREKGLDDAIMLILETLSNKI